MNSFKLLYGYDTLCGWCYGFIPTIKHFAEHFPDIHIELIPGGLFKGQSVQAYSYLLPHISKQAGNLQRVTGAVLGQGFIDMLNDVNAPVSHSAPPAHAILQMHEQAPEKTLAFAHALQEAHFRDGIDLNIADSYNAICKSHNLPKLDTQAIIQASEKDANVAQSYARATALGIQSFPTILIEDENKKIIGTIHSTYDPATFIEQYKSIIAA